MPVFKHEHGLCQRWSILLYFTSQVQLNKYDIDVELLNLLPSCNNDTVDLERGTAARPPTNNLEANTNQVNTCKHHLGLFIVPLLVVYNV